jgi:hypothetical protein
MIDARPSRPRSIEPLPLQQWYGDVLRIGGTYIAFCAPATSHGATDPDGTSGRVLAVSPAQRRVLIALCRPYLEEDDRTRIRSRKVHGAGQAPGP